MHEIKYNRQTNNENYKGTFLGSIQCFGTSAVMFLSFYDKRYEETFYETQYIDDVEATVGKKGTAEEIKGWTGRSSQWWSVHIAALKKILPKQGLVYTSTMTLDKLKQVVQISPVILGLYKIGNLPGGHIVLVVGYDSRTDEFILEDPFGNPNTNYKDSNGHQVRIKRAILAKFFRPNAIYATVPVVSSALVKKKK